MAIDEGSEQVTLVKQDRLWRFEVFVDDNDKVQLRFHRERVFKLNGVIQHRKKLGTTDRLQAAVATESYTAGGTTRTGNQILALINKMADDERAKDIANPPPNQP